MVEEVKDAATGSLPTGYRWVYSFGSVLVTVLICASIATWSHGGIVANSTAILFVSLVGFHATAWLSYERKLAWQSLDYALELITITSLIAVVAGIQQSAVAEILQSEFARRKAEQASLLYSLKSTITNDCHIKESRKDIWTPAPEPYSGACDRIEHFLPQIEYSFGNETGVETMTADDSWARNLLVSEDAATGSWKGLYDEARRFTEGSHRTRAVLDSQGKLSSEFVRTLAGSGKLQYWQYLLAFVLGLKISRRSASLLEGRAKERLTLASKSSQQTSASKENSSADAHS